MRLVHENVCDIQIISVLEIYMTSSFTSEMLQLHLPRTAVQVFLSV